MPSKHELAPNAKAGTPRKQAKQEIRLAYVTGRATMRELAEHYGIPYNTVQAWSKRDKWHVEEKQLAPQIHREATAKAADWIVQEQSEQIRRALVRASRIRELSDSILDDGTITVVTKQGERVQIPLGSKDLANIALAEDKADAIVRRNLGLGTESGGSTKGTGGSVNINILSQGAAAVEVTPGR